MERFSAIWKLSWTGTPAVYTYLNLTSNTKTNTAFDFISATTNYFYFGSSKRFIGIYCDLSTNGSYSGVTYEYFDGDDWNPLSLIDSYNWNESKYVRWLLPDRWQKYNFTEEEPHITTTLPDTSERYWVRVGVTGYTTTAVISKIRSIPYCAYTSPTNVSEFLQLKNDFNSSTRPTDLAVENLIRRAEDYIDYRTRKSFKFNVVSETTDPQLTDYNRYGVFLRHRNFYKVYSVSLWNGSAWDTLTEGRNNDYFVNYDLGLIYFTRLFLLPAAYGMTGRYFLWGYGEYKNSVKVDYIYGRDIETVPAEFYIVEDLATKMASVDLLRHTDYSNLTVSGTDKVPLESKIRLLEEQIEQRLDELTGIAVY